jgi:periplasmic copper chaperone A
MMANLRRALLCAALAILPSLAAWSSQPTDASLRVEEAWSRATAPGATVAAVYLSIHGGTTDDRLVGVSTQRAAMAQIHSVTTEAGVARMREATAGIAIPASATVTLAPHGLHIMLMGLAAPLVDAEQFTLTLEFAKAGTLDVVVTVQPATATGPARH